MRKSVADREGRIFFGDASLYVKEEGLLPGMTIPERDAWEEAFKAEVFDRMCWMLRKLGWKTEIDPEQFEDCKKNHGLKFAQMYCAKSRVCSHGDLKGHIDVSGRCIKFKTWQGINTPTRPDHGGQFEHHKEKVMPYLLRLRMERTRRKLRDYLMHLFPSYTFKDSSPKAKDVGVGGRTALEAIQESIRESGHYKEHLGHAQIHTNSYRYSRDGVELQHGITKGYAFDRDGRPVFGTVYYDLNGNWIIQSGKYGRNWFWHNDIYVNTPESLRTKRNDRLRHQRLSEEMSKAVKAMDFLRAHTLKGIIYPSDEELFVLIKKGLYHRVNFCGYTDQLADAGKFTRAQLKHYENSRENKIIPLKELTEAA